MTILHIAPDHTAAPLVATAPGFFSPGCPAPGPPAPSVVPLVGSSPVPGCPAPVSDAFLIVSFVRSAFAPGCPSPGSPAFPVVSITGLDAPLYDISVISLVDSGTMKLLAEVRANLFGDNLSVNTHRSDDGSICEQACGMSTAVGVDNLLGDVKAIFNAWIQCSSCSGSIVSVVDWRRQVCNRSDKSFLEGMYLLSCVKLLSMLICDYHLLLFSTKFYLAHALSSDLCACVFMIW